MTFTMTDSICPGDEVTVAGVVTGVEAAAFTLELEISTQLGVATTATAGVVLPVT